jgi:hypothetical protein
MSLKKKIAVGLAACALVLGGLFAAPVAAFATGNPHSLDQGDLTSACRLQPGQSSYGWNAQLYGNTVYSWKCVYLGNPNTKTNVDINKYCQTYWGVWAATRNPSSPYSWYCQGY